MLSRFRFLLALGTLGAALAAPTVAAEPVLVLSCRDTPVRTALELLFTLTGKQYQMGNGVMGLITMSVSGITFSQTMNLLQQATPTPFSWTESASVISVQRVGPLGTMPELPQNPPGFARTAAVGTFGNVRKAVLEFGPPPNSTMEVVGVGVLVRDSTTGKEWRVASIGPKGCELRAGSEKRILPLAGLTPPRR